MICQSLGTFNMVIYSKIDTILLLRLILLLTLKTVVVNRTWI